uniref:C2H2-type domain-containing protein n=1 Tax=Bracon brevicornis TaxID=1563983 RepID=A0A6V7J188_9HYME
MEQKEVEENQPECSYVSCKLCDEKLPGMEELLAHNEKHYDESKVGDPKDEKYYCKNCYRIFVGSDIFRNHVTAEHSGEENFNCPVCPAKFQKIEERDYHVNLNHKARNSRSGTIFKCVDCSTSFHNQLALATHRGKRPLKDKGTCHFCDRYFCTLELLKEHYKKFHEVRGPEYSQYFCEKCNKYFQGPSSLKVHSNVHKKKEYKCTTCNQIFKKPHLLKAHEKGHDNPFFYCAHCPAVFFLKRSLKRHMPTHSPPEEWKYKCDLCNKKFPDVNKYNSHMIQDQIKHMVKCHLCSMELLGRDRLKRHYNQKHGTDPIR